MNKSKRSVKDLSLKGSKGKDVKGGVALRRKRRLGDVQPTD